MFLVFSGLALGLAYGLLGAGLLWCITDTSDAYWFLSMYIRDFNTMTAFGLALATALIVYFTQGVFPDTIEAAFTEDELASTEYYEQKERFYSRRRTITFGSETILIGGAIFYLCHFPLSVPAQILMMIAGCAQWALGGYVGRKLRYAGPLLSKLAALG